MPRCLRRDEIKALAAMCGDLIPIELPEKCFTYVQGWVLHQPSAKALLFVDAIESLVKPPLVVGFHVALDFVTASAADADAVREYLECHLAQGWQSRKVDPNRDFLRASYSDYRRLQPQRWVAYSSRPCRVTGEPFCCHLEWQIAKAKTCRRIRVKRPADLLGIEFREFWRSKLRLFEIDVQKLGRRLTQPKRDRLAKPKSRRWVRGLRWVKNGVDQYRLAAQVFLHAIQDDRDQPSMEMVIRALRIQNIRPESVLKRIDQSPWLPIRGYQLPNTFPKR
jgi:hypothetical protein